MRDDLQKLSPEVRATVAVECMRRADRIQAEETQVGWNGVPRSRDEAIQAGLREFLDDYALFRDAIRAMAPSESVSAGTEVPRVG